MSEAQGFVCSEYTPWGGNAAPPMDYPADACGACGAGEEAHSTRPDDYVAVAASVAAARVALAEAFIRFKIKTHAITDGQAMQQAIVETGSALDIAEARLEVARHRLNS